MEIPCNTNIQGPNGLGQPCHYRLGENSMLEARHPDGHWLPIRKATEKELSDIRTYRKMAQEKKLYEND